MQNFCGVSLSALDLWVIQLYQSEEWESREILFHGFVQEITGLKVLNFSEMTSKFVSDN